TIYEGYLCHYGRPRLFSPDDDELALLLGDYLYAHGLVRISATGRVGAVVQLAELISICSRLRAESESGDAEAWLAPPRAPRPAAGSASCWLPLGRASRGRVEPCSPFCGGSRRTRQPRGRRSSSRC